jgi:hypothetical protein
MTKTGRYSACVRAEKLNVKTIILASAFQSIRYVQGGVNVLFVPIPPIAAKGTDQTGIVDNASSCILFH